MSAGLDPPPGYRLVALDWVDSTNDEAKRLATAGAEAGTVVWARAQSGGRGRRGRSWSSPPGNLYCSLLLRPEALAAEIGQLCFVAALGVGDAVAGLLPAGAEVRLKWPNDVLIGGAKVAGILIETASVGGGGVQWVIVGTGINVASSPRGSERAATALAEEGAEVSVEAVLEAYLRSLDGWLGRWRGEGFGPVREAWLARATGLGRTVEVRLSGQTLSGTFAALDASGALILDAADGSRRVVTAGEVFLPGEAIAENRIQ